MTQEEKQWVSPAASWTSALLGVGKVLSLSLVLYAHQLPLLVIVAPQDGLGTGCEQTGMNGKKTWGISLTVSLSCRYSTFRPPSY